MTDDDDHETPDADAPLEPPRDEPPRAEPQPAEPPQEEPRRGADDAALVALVLSGDRDAFGRLYDRWFDRVLDLAYRVLWDADAAADVAQEAFLSAWRNLGHLEDPHAFGGWLLRIARNGALDRQRKDRRVRPVAEEQLAMIDGAQTRPEDLIGTIDDPARVAEDASYVELLWDAAGALGDRDREVLDLSLRHGMTPAELAEVVGINRNAANQLVHRVRQRLATAVGARMLWRGGTPACAALRAELVEADVEVFGDEAVRVTERHAASCTECSERRRTLLSPERMFAAVPIMVLPSLKAKVAFALQAQGAPMGGSDALNWSAAGERGEGSRSRRGGRRKWLVAGGIAAGIIIALIIAAVARDGGEPARVAIAPVSTTSTSTRSSTTTTSSTSTTTTSSTTSTTTTTVPVVVPVTPPPTVPPTPTTTIPVTVTYTLTPNRIAQGYPLPGGAPVLNWSIGGARRVHVHDSAGAFDSTKASGTTRVCPQPNNQSVSMCEAPAGTYTYTLDAYNAANAVVLHRTLTLTITSP